MSERSTAEVVWVYMVFPPLVALLFAGITVYFTVVAAAESEPTPWLGLLWMAIVLPLVASVLPMIGWREVQKRRREAAKVEVAAATHRRRR